MAGLYADVPGVRIPYHVDGSLVGWVPTVSYTNSAINGNMTFHSSAEVGKLNDGDVTTVAFAHTPGGTSARYLVWLFSGPVNITGHNLHMTYAGGTPTNSPLEYSTDCIDGIAGTWNSTPQNIDSVIVNDASLRSITTVNLTNIKAMRLWMSNVSSNPTFSWRDVAFYGTWTPQTLAGWHPTLDQQIPAAHLDYGDIAQGAVVIKQFRIKNGRAFTANNVVVSAPIGNAQTTAGLTFSLDNSTYATSRTITSIAPGAISPVVYVKRTVGMAEALANVGIAPVQFVATSWT